MLLYIPPSIDPRPGLYVACWTTFRSSEKITSLCVCVCLKAKGGYVSIDIIYTDAPFFGRTLSILRSCEPLTSRRREWITWMLLLLLQLDTLY